MFYSARDLQHPDITRAERYGMPEADPICCPECGEECETIYLAGGMVLGCDCCIEAVDAEKYIESIQD